MVKTATKTADALARCMSLAGLTEGQVTLVLGVSGGPDSLALLDILARFLPPERLVVAHLDHALRPTSADEGQQVMRAAADRGLRGFIERIDIPASPQGAAGEEAARTARYDFLARIARATGAPAVVVGHNADDQVETILMHLIRGSGVTGLRGMSPAGPLPGTPDLWLLRPLLGIPRAGIAAYCREAGLTPVDDASNADTIFQRNRVRHEMLPLLETYNPQIRSRLRELGSVAGAEDDLLISLEAESWSELLLEATADRVILRRDAWQALPLALRRRLLRRAAVTCEPALRDLGFHAVEGARQIAESGQTGTRATLPGGVTLWVGYGRLELTRANSVLDNEWPQLLGDVALSVPGEALLAHGWRLTAGAVVWANLAAIAVNRDPWTAYVAVEEATVLTVRGRRSGELIRPLGLNGATKLKEVMIDRKIPAAARKHWPLVATADHPVWLAGHILDDRCRVQPDSTRVVRLHCAREK